MHKQCQHNLKYAGGPCENNTCSENQFRCDGSVCFPKYWVCDGDKDCNDGSDEDEKYCKGVCSEQQFTCEASKRCIPLAWKCDGVVDCGPNDHSDERNCSKSTVCFASSFPLLKLSCGGQRSPFATRRSSSAGTGSASRSICTAMGSRTARTARTRPTARTATSRRTSGVWTTGSACRR